MKSAGTVLKVMNPRGRVEDGAAERPLSQRIADLTGKRIGILNNGKLGAEALLPFLREALARRIHSAAFKVWSLPMSSLAEDRIRILQNVARSSDGVIALLGD